MTDERSRPADPLRDVPEQWPVAHTEDLHRDAWVVALRADEVRRPGHLDDEPFRRLVIEHPGAAVVLAVDEDERVLCLWQYRHVVGLRMVQLPAGLLDVAGEDARQVAERELAEEAGYAATQWVDLGARHSSPGILAERTHYFLARGLSEVGRGDFEPEHEEAEMSIGWVPVADLRAAVLSGEVGDAHLALALLLADARGLLAG